MFLLILAAYTVQIELYSKLYNSYIFIHILRMLLEGRVMYSSSSQTVIFALLWKFETQSYYEHTNYSLHSSHCGVFGFLSFALATSLCCPAGLY